MKTDNIYAQRLDKVTAFEFDDEVVKVFPDMINRSLPAFGQITSLTGALSAMYATANSNIYDLGCSAGATSIALRNFITQQNVHLQAFDSSAQMVAACQENLSKQKSDVTYEVICQDVMDVKIENASLVVMNFVLQFIAVEHRLALLEKIYNGLNSGGVLLLAEKIISTSDQHQQNYDLWLETFKKTNGYSELEIVQKRKALENVLITESEQQHNKRLRQAGFAYVQKWFQAFNFKAFVAFK